MTHVVDASALLALILDEPGADRVLAPARLLHISVVNPAEVYTKVVEAGGSAEDARTYVGSLPIRVRSFTEAHTLDVAALRTLTRHRGLSLGDRACLALARSVALPVLTADTQWHGLDVGVDIQLIR